MLLIIECKTAGQEYNKALKNTKQDGGQLFSYLQQERSTQWLVLYCSDWKDDNVEYQNTITTILMSRNGVIVYTRLG